MSEKSKSIPEILIECPFCAKNPEGPIGWIILTPCNGLYACDKCGAKVIAPIKKFT